MIYYLSEINAVSITEEEWSACLVFRLKAGEKVQVSHLPGAFTHSASFTHLQQ